MNNLSVSGGSPVCAEYQSHYDQASVALGDPPERMSE